MAGYAIVPDIDAPELTATDLAVWAALCRYTDWEMEDGKPVRSKAGTCYPSQEDIARQSRLTSRTVRSALRHLEALGYLRREASRSHGQFTVMGYTLLPNGGNHRNVVPTENNSDGNKFRNHRKDVPLPSETVSGDIYRVLPCPYTMPIDHEKKQDIKQERCKEAEGKAAAADALDRVSLGQVTKLWNDRLGVLGFPLVVKETTARTRAFQARVNEAPERRTLAWWKGLISRVEGAEFLRDSAQQKAGWLNFDWLLNENNLVKVLEGRYDGRKTPFPRGQPRGNPSMAEYLAELQKDPFFGGSGEEDMSDGYREQAGNDGVRSLPEGGGRPVRAGSPEQRGSQSLRPAVTGF